MSQGVAFRPTDDQRRMVKAMAGLGVPHEGIAILLEIDPKTLRKYFQPDLNRGSVEATAKVAQSLFQMATTGKSVAAAIFWMKARAGWREKHEVQISSTDSLRNVSDEELRHLSDAELERMLYDLKEQSSETPESSTPVIEGAAEEDSGRAHDGDQAIGDVQRPSTTVGRW